MNRSSIECTISHFVRTGYTHHVNTHPLSLHFTLTVGYSTVGSLVFVMVTITSSYHLCPYQLPRLLQHSLPLVGRGEPVHKWQLRPGGGATKEPDGPPGVHTPHGACHWTHHGAGQELRTPDHCETPRYTVSETLQVGQRSSMLYRSVCVVQIGVSYRSVCHTDQCVVQISVPYGSVCCTDRCVVQISVPYRSVCHTDQCAVQISVSYKSVSQTDQ